MLRRREEFRPDLLSFGDLTLNIQSGTLSCGNMDFVLPKQEYRLMEQLMINYNIFLSSEDLLIKAWGYDAETDINSVWLYISYLRKRLLAMESTVEIVSKRNIGYRLEICLLYTSTVIREILLSWYMHRILMSDTNISEIWMPAVSGFTIICVRSPE